MPNTMLANAIKHSPNPFVKSYAGICPCLLVVSHNQRCFDSFTSHLLNG